MAGSVGGFPVHNYGSDPLGKMGLQMMQSSMDWDEKKKLRESEALNEAAKQREDAFSKNVDAGTATPGQASQIYGEDIGPGVDVRNKQNQFMNYLKDLNQTADLSKKKQDYQSAEIAKTMASLEYWGKKKKEAFEAGQDVVPLNDNLDVLGKKLSQLTGLQFDAVRMTDVSEIKKFKEDAAIKQVSDIEQKLTEAMARGDLKSAAGAASALGSQIMTSSKQLGMSKETFAAANETLKQFQQELPKMLAEKVKPKEPKPTSLLAPGTKQDVQKGTQKVGQRLEYVDGKPVWKDIPGAVGPQFAPPQPQTDESKNKFQASFDARLTSAAHKEAVSQTRMKHGTDQFKIVIGESGQPSVAAGSSDEAINDYQTIYDKLIKEKRERAVKLGQLPATYLDEAPKKITPPDARADTSYKTADEVKAAFNAKTITKEAAAKILREKFGFK